MKYEPKPAFVNRIKLLLDNERDVEKFFKTAKTKPKKSIRVNTLKISPNKLKKKLEDYGWKISQPCSNYPEIMQIISQLKPGEVGKTKEHLLGYYYVQEITSMMPIIALNPKSEDILLDCCAAPGSKTTQAAVVMKNKGTIFANDLTIGRVVILSANLERQGITNTIITRHDAIALTNKFKKIRLKFKKILLDAPCSGEGNIRVSPKTYAEWSEKLVKSMGKKQKKIASALIELLEENGEMVYSTCTYAPEENEEVIQYLLDNYDIEISKIELPIKTRSGISKWNGIKFSNELKKCHRIYHHDNDMEGFFVCKIKKLGDKK